MDLVAIAAVAGPVLGAGGLVGGVKWVFARIDRYQDRIEKRLKEVEEDNDNCNRRFNLLLGAFMPVIGALRQKDPESPELRIAEAALKKAFAVDPTIPADMAELLNKIT